MSNTNWTSESVKALLDRDALAVERAVCAIYRRQTDDEQESESTKHHNARGFSAFHAGTGTYYARWIMSGRRLSGRHLEKARKLAKHYAGQLIEVILEKTQSQTQGAAQ